MKSRKNTILIAIVWFVLPLCSCRDDMEGIGIDTSKVGLIDIDSNKSKLIDVSDVESVEIIIPETGDEFLLGDFDKILFRDHMMFIKPYNRGKVYLFSSEGEGLGVIERPGSGPGEYLQLTDFDVDSVKQQVIILDGSNLKVLRYTYGGELVSETPLDMRINLLKNYYVGDDINYVGVMSFGNPIPGQTSSYEFNIFSENWELLSQYFENDKPHMSMFGNFFMLFNQSGGIAGYYKPFTDAIYHFEGDRMFQAYRLKFSLPVLSSEVHEADPLGHRSTKTHTYNIVYDESDTHLYVKYMQQGQVYCVLYNKIENDMQHFTYPGIRGNCSMEIFQSILGLNGSRLVIQSDPSELPCIREFFGPILNDNQVQVLDQIGEYDNNFLLLVKWR